MLWIKGPSDKPCFITGSKEKCVEVRFDDKSFAGTLCMEEIYKKIKPPEVPRVLGERKSA